MFAYKLYVLPILDYCSPVWSPSKLSDTDHLENVQRYFTKRLDGLWSIPYAERFSICNLVSLEQRRLTSDIILCYKIVYNLVDLKLDDFFIFDKNVKTRGHKLKLRVPLCKSNVRHNLYSVRVVPTTNSLPQSVVETQPIHLFREQLLRITLPAHLNRNFQQISA